MWLAHGGEITADEIGELALLSLPVAALLVLFVVLARRSDLSASRAAEGDGPAPLSVPESATAVDHGADGAG